MLTETRVVKLRLVILISLFVLLLMSHLRGQLIFPLRGIFIATGISLISIVVVLIHWRELQLRMGDVWVLISYLGFTGWAGIGTLTAPVPAEAYPYLGTYIEGGLILVSVLILFRRIKWSDQWCVVFLLLLLVVSLVKALAQYFWEFSQQLAEFSNVVDKYPSRVRDGIIFALQEKRVFAYYGNPNIFCGFLALCFPATLWLLSFKPALQRSRLNLTIRLTAVIIILLAIVIAILTGSRGGLLALILGGAIYYYLRGPWAIWRSHRGIWLVGLGSLGGVILIMCLVVFYAPWEESNWRARLGRWTNLTTLNQRYYYLEAAAKMIGGAPIQGNGLGSYGIFYPRVKREEALESRYAHNFLAQIWAELGLV
ncbi:MAG: O-antigen ligase family protein, partial [Candidatus Sumerlaeia bacterium]|nr:O-antigen ligase family protein [Candidatus Sumerlaeia bacterium]